LHFGSMYAMSDYKSNSHNIYFASNLIATDRLSFSLLANYNKSDAELDQVLMPDITDRLMGELTHQDFTFDEMHTYSNLDYELFTGSLGAEYMLSEGVTVTANLDYADLADNAGYVYGIESGSYFVIRGGFRFDF